MRSQLKKEEPSGTEIWTEKKKYNKCNKKLSRWAQQQKRKDRGNDQWTENKQHGNQTKWALETCQTKTRILHLCLCSPGEEKEDGSEKVL